MVVPLEILILKAVASLGFWLFFFLGVGDELVFGFSRQGDSHLTCP